MSCIKISRSVLIVYIRGSEYANIEVSQISQVKLETLSFLCKISLATRRYIFGKHWARGMRSWCYMARTGSPGLWVSNVASYCIVSKL